MTGRVIVSILAVLLLSGVMPVKAVERILSYHSQIDIAEDASMTVRESIRVVAEGSRIRRGIYREFPTTYRDRLGNKYTVIFEVLEVTRDGKPEPWHTKKRSNGVRIYAGSSNVFLTPGQYNYTFTYTTNRQIGFFTDHDELYWNVTGNGWDFTIEQASATVNLPHSVSASDITMAGYTGAFGQRGNNFTVAVSSGSGTIETRTRLNPQEGLTLVMGWPQGVVQKPGAMQKFAFVLQDNLGVLLAMVALCGSLCYLVLMWFRYGRDLPAGVVFPHYSPPSGYSPASARYISKMKYDDKTFAAAVVNLAVKGHLAITCNDEDDYTLSRLSCSQDLAPGEQALIDTLFKDGTVVQLVNSNHARVSTARFAHKRALKRDYLNLYFKTNVKLLLPSVLGSMALLFVILVMALFVPMVLFIYALIVLTHCIFMYLLKAPSQRGRRLMDKLDGFKLYLEVAEKDDLNRQHPPKKTPELFEKYLPFAIALGVEQKWGEQFSAVFAQLESGEGGQYRPVWYNGRFSSARMGDFTDSVSSNFSSAISTAASPPGSSSGSGGSSGGGGGGGGGGGW